MKKLIILLNVLWLSSAQAADCFVFNKIDRESQLRSLKITLGPAQSPKSPESFKIAQLTVKDLNGDDLSGQVGCNKTSATVYNCQRPDDGGGFELELDGHRATFTASYFVMGSDEDKLTLQSEKDDPWVFEGQACGKASTTPAKAIKR